jgi:hypothetical protein
MTPSRRGKIARLPNQLRNQLNHRLEDGEPAGSLLAWLNNHPEVQAVLKAQFGERPITEQNLSEWRKGGYLDWLRHEENCALVSRLAKDANGLEVAADQVNGEVAVSDRLAPILAAELARTAQALLEEAATPQERWQRLQGVLQQLAELRRHDHRAARLRRDQAVWERADERLDEEANQRQIEEIKRKATAPFWAAMKLPTYAGMFGGGEAGRQTAAFILEVTNDLPIGSLSSEQPPGPAKGVAVPPGQTGSNSVQCMERQ